MSSTDKAGLPSLLDPGFGIPPDVTFTCREHEGKHEDLGEVHAHKIVLALKSTVFKKMIYTQGERLQTYVVTNIKAFKLMINFMYEKEDIWAGISLVELFQVAFLATKYNMEGLMDKVVEQCRNLPSTGLEILEAASIAEEFADLFPQAAEAVLETCTEELQQRLTTPEHFIQFATEHSTDPARSGTAFRLLARLKKEEGPRDAHCALDVTPSKVTDVKLRKGKKCEEIINCESASPPRPGSLCSNCGQEPCLDRQPVMDTGKVTPGCQLRHVQRDYLATVVKIHPEGYNSRPLRVEVAGILRNHKLETKPRHPKFNYDCGGTKTESPPITRPAASKPSKGSQYPPAPFSCTNCRQSPCLHDKPVLNIKKVPVGCHLLSASTGYFQGAAPMVATVVAVDQLGCPNPLRVAWPKGCPSKKGPSNNRERSEQNCPLPTKTKHTPTFTYFCTGE